MQPFERYSLASHFQPIFSVAHGRAVGYEALVRAADPNGAAISPLELFARFTQPEERVALDRECRRRHVCRFLELGEPDAWLYLNVDPFVATEGTRFGSFFGALLEGVGLAPHRVAVELIESPYGDRERLAGAIEYYRALGCLIVIDDFGAGHSNFDRIWRLRPDVVKIDRAMTAQAARNPLARRMFQGIVATLHEAGALVCVEGIETQAEAICALEGGADLMQGYFFAKPAPTPVAADACQHRFASMFALFHAQGLERLDRRRNAFEPYAAALRHAVRLLAEGGELPVATLDLVRLPCTQRCYLLRGDGSQAGPNLEAERNDSARDPRLAPLQPRGRTTWQHKPYFRRAVNRPGELQITRPYLSVTGPKLCVTLSLAFVGAETTFVLCADLDFSALLPEG